MTLVVAWASIDTSVSAVYFAADSRISWGKKFRWDRAQKVFVSRRSSEIWAYCGDVIFPTQTLSQICAASELGLLGLPTDIDERVGEYRRILENQLSEYPRSCLAEKFEILYATFSGKKFYVYHFTHSQDGGIASNVIPLPKKSGLLKCLGSCTKTAEALFEKHHDGGYRAFQAFAHILESKQSATIGGVPQIVSLRRNGSTVSFGIHFHGQSRFLGIDIPKTPRDAAIEWRNHNLEITDAKGRRTGIPQPRPRTAW